MRCAIIFFFLFSTIESSAQLFSGEIIYKITVLPKYDSITVEDILKNKPGTNIHYLITDKYYKATYFSHSDTTYSYTYHNETQRIYDNRKDKKYITFRDSRKSNYQYYNSLVFRDSITEVLGHQCYMVKSDSEYGKSKTYYSDDVKVNPESFNEHMVGNWYNELKQVNGSIVLKTITEHPDHIEIQEAVNIISRPVNREEFSLPKKKEIVASPSALDKKVKVLELDKKAVACYKRKISDIHNYSNEPIEIVVYLNFVVTETGEVKFVQAIEEDEHGFYMRAIEILQDCKFQFEPGELEGKPVSSQVYMPLTFKF